MSDKKRCLPRICGNCSCVGRRDIERKFCPVTAKNIYANKPADKCGFYSALGCRRRGKED